MQRIYNIEGLDCANCAAKLERNLKTVSYFEDAVIDFMAKRLIVTVRNEDDLAKGILEAEQVIARVEPGVTITEKVKKQKVRHSEAEEQEHCGCGHDHHHDHKEQEHCGCGHDHHHDHEEQEHCGCGHDHHHDHEEQEHCGCGHDHHHDHEEQEHCGCGHDHHHDHEEQEHCGCGHDHHHNHEEQEHCGCGHDHHHDHEEQEHCGCGHDHHTHHEHPSVEAKEGDCVFMIRGLDCANCAAKLERNLQELPCFENVTIDFMAQKLIMRLKESYTLPQAMQEVQAVIQRVEPGVTLTEKQKKEKGSYTEKHSGHEELHENADTTGSVRNNASRFTPEMKQSAVKIAVSTLLVVLANLIPMSEILTFGMYLMAYLIVGGEIVLRAAKNITHGQIFDENFLMSVATIGAFCVGEYPEGVMVMLLYQMGELFQDYAVNRSRGSIAELMDIKPEVAHVKHGERFLDVEPDEVALGDLIQIRPGEKVPLDGLVIEGTSALDTVALTGESVPQDVAPGQHVLSGCINTIGVLTVRVEKEFEDSTVARILDLVENASSKKAEAENFITKFARYYTPVVVCVALVLAVIPPLVLQQPFSGWIYRALVFLVISCPCALVISIPLTFFGGLGACSSHGVLVKGSNYLEALAQLEVAVFDKTGTLTKGHFAVTEVYAEGIEKEELLYYAACAESVSNHPIARAVQQANHRQFTAENLQHAEEITGRGIAADVDGHKVLAGNYRLMERENIKCQRAEEAGTIVYVAVDGKFKGWILIADEIKEDAAEMIRRLKSLGVQQIVMLTGDNQKTAELVGNQLGITRIFSQLLPGDKVSCLEQLQQQKQGKGTVSFTGDGLNDAPVLARADVGIAMGGLGSDAAIEAADVVIMNDQPSKLADAITIARQTRAIVKQNVVFILAVKLLVLVLGALGMATMWMAVFADVGVAVLAILNAVRIIRK